MYVNYQKTSCIQCGALLLEGINFGCHPWGRPILCFQDQMWDDLHHWGILVNGVEQACADRKGVRKKVLVQTARFVKAWVAYYSNFNSMGKLSRKSDSIVNLDFAKLNLSKRISWYKATIQTHHSARRLFYWDLFLTLNFGKHTETFLLTDTTF